jgi:hypothetical protein
MSALMLRTSERTSFKTCRQKWWWSYVERLKPREESGNLVFGDLVHQALAAYYKKGIKRGPHPARTFEKLYQAAEQEAMEGGFNVFADEEWTDALELGVVMLEGYVEQYAEEDKAYKVLSSEQTFELPIWTEVNGVRRRFKYVGTFDGLWKDRSTAEVFFKEFKTAASIDLTPLPMDEQAGSYWTYGPKWLVKQGILKDGELPSKILYTFLRKAKPDPRPEDEQGRKLNKDRTVSKKQPPPLFVRQAAYRDEGDRRTLHKRVQDEMAEMIQVREGSLPVYKNPGPWFFPNCRMCPFRDMCELHETGADWEPMKAEYVEWEPYGAHERIERR